MAKKDEKLIVLLKELAIKVSGKNSENIINILFKKKNINEFKIADKMELTINQVRNFLYKLSDAGVMSSTKKKDKKKGWYTYFWTLEIFKALKVLEKIKQQELMVLQNLLKKREAQTFYFCQTDNIEMNESTALHHNFLCPECGQLLQPAPKEKRIKEITSRVEAINKTKDIISEQIERFKPIIPVLLPKVKKLKKVKKIKKKKIIVKEKKVKTAKKKIKSKAKKAKLKIKKKKVKKIIKKKKKIVKKKKAKKKEKKTVKKKIKPKIKKKKVKKTKKKKK